MEPHQQYGKTISRVDGTQLQRNFIIFVGFVGSIVLAGLTLKTGNIFLMAGFIALPFVLILLNRPDLAFTIGIIADASEIPISGISYLTLGVLSQILIIGYFILSNLLLEHKRSNISYHEDRPLKVFVGIILCLMFFRGTGLRLLGSETWGGMVYISIILSILFYWAIRRITISMKLVRRIIYGSIIASIIGALVQRNGFIAALATESTINQSVGASRITWLTPMVYALFPLLLAVKWRFKPTKWLLLLSMIGVVGLTGFRSRLVMLIMIIFLYELFSAKQRFRYLIVVGITGLFMWGGVVFTSPHFPQGLQRAVSFIPGATVDSKIRADAEHSIEWRTKIWEYCLQESRPYLFLGRGSAFNVWETSGDLGVSDIYTFSPWFAFQTRSYHSGPLSLLIDYGLPGFIFGLWLALAIFVRICRTTVRLSKINTIYARYAMVLCSWLLWEIIAFFLVFGAMPAFGAIIKNAAVAIVISESVLRTYSDEYILSSDNPSTALLDKSK